MNNIKFVTYNDKKYPQKLKQIGNYPVCLFYIGNIDILNSKIVAIIGCRECSNYGKQVAVEFAYKLSKKGFIVISGGARGIDTFANIGTLATTKPTAVVLGNGLNYIYPSENKMIEENIIKNGGLLISEYFNDCKPNKYTFPARNRIISALCDAVIVIEAKEKSGSFITVDFALEQGKNIYAVPGNIYSKNSIGTNMLIQQGAKLVTKVEDVLEDFI